MNIADLVRQLQSEIKEQYGVTAKVEIISYSTDNALDKDKADIFVHKIARQFTGSTISHNESNGSFWANVDLPYEEHLEITAFYHSETKEGDSHSS